MGAGGGRGGGRDQAMYEDGIARLPTRDSRVYILPLALVHDRGYTSTFCLDLAPSSRLHGRICRGNQKSTFKVCTVSDSVAVSYSDSGEALQIANEQRNAYGLRYNDYERYRCVHIALR